MNTVLTIIEFIIAIGILAFLHELGHFLAARLCKIEIEEFGFGFPPRMARLFSLGGTEFTINWIPFGAFVKPKGENNPDVPGGLAAAKPWPRMAVLFGGPIMNLLAGVLFFSIISTVWGGPDSSQALIAGVTSGFPAEKAGLRACDVVVSVNSEAVDGTEKLRSLIQKNPNTEVDLSFLRDGQTLQTRATPIIPSGETKARLGIIISNPFKPVVWYKSIPLAFQTTYLQIRELLLMPIRMIQGTIPPEQGRVVGIVGMGNIYEQIINRDQSQQLPCLPPAGMYDRLTLLATISIALGITNLFPLPALDGGRIVFVLPELLFKKRVPAKYENLVHSIGFILLIILMIVITTQDIINPVMLP
jgi:regulator of sigma E protease